MEKWVTLSAVLRTIKLMLQPRYLSYQVKPLYLSKTAIFACTLSGKFLPIQLIYQGTTSKCLLKTVNFDWHLTYMPSYWANEETSMAYIDNIIIPYAQKERISFGLSSEHCALVLFDAFKGQCMSKVLKKLEDNNILYNCTDRLQPLDVLLTSLQKTSCRANFNSGMELRSASN